MINMMNFSRFNYLLRFDKNNGLRNNIHLTHIVCLLKTLQPYNLLIYFFLNFKYYLYYHNLCNKILHNMNSYHFNAYSNHWITSKKIRRLSLRQNTWEEKEQKIKNFQLHLQQNHRFSL